MKAEQWQKIKENYGEQREFLDGVFYRLRLLPENKAEMAIIHSGPCGETIHAPKVTFSQENLQPLSAFDSLATPTINLSYEQAPEKVSEIFNSTVEKFLNAKNLG
ncbi:hypothetical protein IGI65_000093 [Enterococcus sp. DIV0755b]|uniref:hypothetical protein n=1 Tax=Enterococcus sp. DIV0755b TaxID=2774657 RepID=UPI003F26A194